MLTDIATISCHEFWDFVIIFSSFVDSFDGPKTVDYIEGASIRDIMFFTYPPHHVQYSLNFISYSGTIKLSALSTSELPSDVIESIVSNMSQQVSLGYADMSQQVSLGIQSSFPLLLWHQLALVTLP